MQKDSHLACYQITVTRLALIGVKTMSVLKLVLSNSTFYSAARPTSHRGNLPPSTASSAKATSTFPGLSKQTLPNLP